MHKKSFFRVSVFILAFLVFGKACFAFVARDITAVEVKGNRVISSATILSKIKTKPNEKYSQKLINEDLKRLYLTGFFTDVSIDVQDYNKGAKVIFIVTEKPIIKEMGFVGNKAFSDKILKKVMRSKVDQMLDKGQLKEDVQAIKDFYSLKGFGLTAIDYAVDADPDTNMARIKIEIKEGSRVKIKMIYVLGNLEFSDKRILKLIRTRRSSLFSSGFYKDDIFNQDTERIRAFYEASGFLDVKVAPELEYGAGGKDLYITINIEEGNRYSVGRLTIKGNRVISEEEIIGKISLTKGAVFSRESLRDDVFKIQGMYFERGYMSAQVTPDSLLNETTQKVDVAYKITENEITYVESVKIRGNEKTKDAVIRREVRLLPGEPFDGEKLRRSKERLYNLGFFEEVVFDTEPGTAKNRKNLIVNVKETKTGEFSFGAGYSSVDRFVGFVNLIQRNFDIANFRNFTGAGQQLALRAEFGTVREDYEVSFTEPWIFGKPFLFGFDGYQRTHKKETDVGYGYDEQRRGGDIRFGKEFGDFLRFDLVQRLEEVEISEVAAEATADLRSEVGTNLINSTSLSMTRDTRDSKFSPRRGTVLFASAENAGGVLGGDKSFTKYTFGSSFYFTQFEKLVLELRFLTGVVQPYDDTAKVPIYERFYAGGANTIRGYRERRVGPRDLVTNDPLGGEAMLIANVEYTFPIVDVIKGAVFYDVGNVWADQEDYGEGKFRSGVGVGVRVKTPIGPIKIDYGYPLTPFAGEKAEGKVYFTVSRGF